MSKRGNNYVNMFPRFAVSLAGNCVQHFRFSPAGRGRIQNRPKKEKCREALIKLRAQRFFQLIIVGGGSKVVKKSPSQLCSDRNEQLRAYFSPNLIILTRFLQFLNWNTEKGLGTKSATSAKNRHHIREEAEGSNKEDNTSLPAHAYLT